MRRRILNSTLVIVLFILTILCVTKKNERIELEQLNIVNWHDYDLILTSGQSLQSKLIGIFSISRNEFSHIGIIRITNSGYKILHATVDQQDGSAIRLDDLSVFIGLSDVCAIKVLRFPNIKADQLNALKNACDYFCRLQVPFDYTFDNKSLEKVYCSELVWNIYSWANILDSSHQQINKPIHPKYFYDCKQFIEVDSLRNN